MTKSLAPHCHAHGDLQHLNKTNTWRWGAELFVVVSLGFIALEEEKCDDKEPNFSLLCAWLSYNIRTKEHDNKVLSSLFLCPWGLLAFEHKKNMTMMSQAFRRCVLGTCSIGTNKCTMMRSWACHRCVIQWLVALEQKSTTMRTPRHCDRKTCNIGTKISLPKP